MHSHYRSVSAALDGPKHKSRPIAELRSLRPCFLAQFRYGPQRGNNALLLYSEDDLLDTIVLRYACVMPCAARILLLPQNPSG